MSNVNIRSKPTKLPERDKDDDEDVIRSPQMIEEDLKAAVVQMDSIESVPANKYKLKEAPVRSPAPIPEAISPAGIPIDLETKGEDKDIVDDDEQKRGEFKIDFGEEVDMTMEGKKSEGYKRSVKGSLCIVALFLISLHLLSEHVTMFSFVVDFDSPELIISAVFYFISTIFILVMLLAALVAPSLSIKEERFGVYYSPILVAGGIDFVAVVMGGGVFGPLGWFYSKDPLVNSNYTFMAALGTLLVNGGLYYGFTRKYENGAVFSFFHPFERVKIEDEHEPDQKQTIEQEQLTGPELEIMESAFGTIESLLIDGEQMIKAAGERSAGSLVDSKGKRANYTSLCERVNELGTALAQIKNEIDQFTQEKTEVLAIIQKLENLDAKEIQKLSSILNK